MAVPVDLKMGERWMVTESLFQAHILGSFKSVV